MEPQEVVEFRNTASVRVIIQVVEINSWGIEVVVWNDEVCLNNTRFKARPCDIFIREGDEFNGVRILFLGDFRVRDDSCLV